MTKPRITLVYGPDGSGKSSFAVSSGRPTKYAELDSGSLSRAYCETPEMIQSAKFYAPATALEDIGRLSTAIVGQSGKGAVVVVHNLTGWREQFSALVGWYLEACKSNIQDIVIDTHTRGWAMARNAFRQRIQDEVPVGMQADRLKRLEYEEPNSQWDAIIDKAKETDKNLYLVCHQKMVWGGEAFIPGSHEPDGWGDIKGAVDITLRFVIKDRQPVAIFEKGPLGLLDMEVPYLTIPKMDELLDAEMAVRAAGLAVPESYVGLMGLAEGLK